MGRSGRVCLSRDRRGLYVVALYITRPLTLPSSPHNTHTTHPRSAMAAAFRGSNSDFEEVEHGWTMDAFDLLLETWVRGCAHTHARDRTHVYRRSSLPTQPPIHTNHTNPPKKTKKVAIIEDPTLHLLTSPPSPELGASSSSSSISPIPPLDGGHALGGENGHHHHLDGSNGGGGGGGLGLSRSGSRGGDAGVGVKDFDVEVRGRGVGGGLCANGLGRGDCPPTPPVFLIS